MGLEQIVPAIALIAVLILVLPNFLRSNSEKKQLFKLFTRNVIHEYGLQYIKMKIS